MIVPPCTTGIFELADLVALRQVGIEIILAREDRLRGDRCADGQAERIARSTAPLFITGSTPGSARSTGLAWVFGSAPNWIEPPLKIFDLVVSCAWFSRPMTTSHCMVFSRCIRYDVQTPSGGALVPVGRRWYWWATLSSFASLK